MTTRIRDGLPRVPRDIDAVVGVARSGMIPAAQIALARELPLADVETAARGDWWRRSTTHQGEPRHVLLVEDAVWKGRALATARERLSGRYAVTTLAVYRDPNRDNGVDVSLAEIPMPRIMEWNIWRHNRLAHIAVDFDGVLCPDPVVADGPEYERWLRTVEPLVVPALPIGHIITGRLERYRPQTEDWLGRHGIQYDRLTMLDGVTAQERRRRGLIVPHKIEHYSTDENSWLYVESEPRQAQMIAQATCLPVLDWKNRKAL